MIRRIFLSLVCLALLGAAPVQTASPFAAVTELFPVQPGINAERGFAVAVSGNWLAMGARLDDEAGEDAGAVHVFHWSGVAWEQTVKLTPDPPQPEKAQFGFSLALRGGVLAVGAPGERAVYVFELEVPEEAEESEGTWLQSARRSEAAPDTDGFGKSLALDDGELAVGAGDGHGRRAGAVYLYRGPLWESELGVQPLQPQEPQEGERFGSAISLEGDVLVVGAPGYDIGPNGENADAGAVYVFERKESVWQQTPQVLRAQDSGSPLPPSFAGDQFGFAVATDGFQIIVGSPTADAAGVNSNSGALYQFVRSEADWIGAGWLKPADPQPGDQLGFSLAMSEDLLAAGSPGSPPAEGPGDVHVFRRSGGSWLELGELAPRNLPGNAEIRDLTGFAVVVNDGRVVVGGVIGDQGSYAAGASWSFRCPAAGACSEEAEAYATFPAGVGFNAHFGRSVALTELSGATFLAVGAPEDDAFATGAAYVYRRAGKGWRQEARLIRFSGDGFGSSVALAGPLLAVGAPVRSPNGAVDLFSREGTSWTLETSLVPLAPDAEEAFGVSVSLGENVVVVGAPRGSQPGAVYVFEKGSEGWSQVVLLTAPVVAAGDEFGAAVSVRDNVLAIGAPGTDGGVGAVYASSRGPMGWSQPQRLPSNPKQGERLGAAVAADGDIIAAGAPESFGLFGGSGAVYLFDKIDDKWHPGWTFNVDAIFELPFFKPFRFGASVALQGDRLVVGAPSPVVAGSGDPDRTILFERHKEIWNEVAEMDAVLAPRGDKFGTAVALSPSFLVVTSPVLVRNPRVTVFEFVTPASGEVP